MSPRRSNGNMPKLNFIFSITTLSTMSKNICTFATKDGKACTRTILGELPLTATGEANGTPFKVVADKKITGSKLFCENHQIFEPWWPRCTICRNSRVDPRASKTTAHMCRKCILDGAHIVPKTFSDPVLDLTAAAASPSGPWAEVVNKYAKKVYKTDTKPAQVAVESTAVTAAKAALEIARKAAQEAEAAHARAIAEEQARVAAIAKQRQTDANNRDDIIALTKIIPSENLEVLVQFTHYISQANRGELNELLESIGISKLTAK
jgi:hypothetical protein